MTFEVGAHNAPDILAGIGMLAIAALLLWVAPNDRLHRAFALFQVVLAGGSLAYAAQLGFAKSDPSMSVAFGSLGGYYVLALAFAAAFFTLRFLDPEGRSHVSRPLAWALLVGTVAVLVAFALDHGLSRGPLGIAWFQMPFTFGAVACIFAMRARRVEASDRRDGLVLASLAFAVIAAYWTCLAIATFLLAPGLYFGLTGDQLSGSPIALVIGRSMAWLGAVALIVTAVLVLRLPPLANDLSLRLSRRAFAVGTAAAAILGVSAAWLLGLDAERFGVLPYTLDGVGRVAMTLILAYALLKRQVFDAEVKLRFAISRSTVAATFVLVFFLASEGAQILFGSGNEWLGLLAAGALVFALSPLQRAAERLAEKAVPLAGALVKIDGPSGVSREALYQTTLRKYLRDGVLTRDEERALAHLAGELGIHAGRAFELRDEVEREFAKSKERV